MNEIVTEPEAAPLSAKQLLQRHGPAGGLILRLQRYALLGWGCFFALAIVFVGYALVAQLRPVPVIAVSEDGRMLGTVDYVDGTHRTEGELLAAARYFTQYYLSMNSATVFEDMALAMNMMETSLREQKLAEVKANDYLARIAAAETRAQVRFGEGAEQPQLIEQREEAARIRLRGQLLLDGPGGRVESPFDVTVTLRPVARTPLATHGVAILNVEDN